MLKFGSNRAVLKVSGLSGGGDAIHFSYEFGCGAGNFNFESKQVRILNSQEQGGIYDWGYGEARIISVTI